MMTATDPEVLLAWMEKRRGAISIRDISDAAPRPFRRRAAANVALAALIEGGEIIEVSARPRSFRVSARFGPKPGSAPGPKLCHLSVQSERIPASDISDLLDAAVAQHRQAGRSEPAALILGAADVRDGLRRDPQHAPVPNAFGLCQHCGRKLEADHAELLHGIRVHLACTLKYRNAVDRQLNALLADALDVV